MSSMDPIRDAKEDISSLFEDFSKRIQKILKTEVTPVVRWNCEEALNVIERTAKVYAETAKEFGELEAKKQKSSLNGIQQAYEALLRVKEKELHQSQEEFNIIIEQAKHLEGVFEGIAIAEQKVLPFKRREICLKGIHPQFEGRKEFLDKISKELAFHRPIVLFGPPGVGKSETAIAFANEHLKQYAVVWTIQGATQRQIAMSYRQLAEALCLSILVGDHDVQIRQKVHKRLGEIEKPCLILFDNLEKPIDFPERNVHSIITCRDMAPFVNYNPIEVRPFSETEALSLFKRMTREEESNEMRGLVNTLGHYPIVLALIGNYIRLTPGVTVSSFYEKIEHVDLSSLHKDARYEAGFKFVLDETFKKLPAKALQWLKICAHICPDQIPRSYLLTWVESQARNRQEQEDKCNGIMAVLANRGLLRYDLNSQSFSIHRLFQKFLKDNVFYSKSANLLCEVSGGIEFDLSKEWEESLKAADVWSAHSALILADELFHDLDGRQKMVLLQTNASWFKTKGRYHESYEEFNKAHQITETTFGEQSPITARSHIYVGTALYNQCKFDESITKCERALEILEKDSKNNLKDRAEALNVMGHNLFSKEKLTEAQEKYGQALKLWTTAFGPNDAHVARAINNIGNCLFTKYEYGEAYPKYQKAAKIWKNCLGINHPFLAKAYNNQANCLRLEGKYKESHVEYEQALQISENAFGPNHPDVGLALIGLSLNFLNQKKYEEALPTLERALKIYEISYGLNHSNTADCLNKMAVCLWNKKEPQKEKAQQYFSQAYEIVKGIFGENHPSTKKYFNSYERHKN